MRETAPFLNGVAYLELLDECEVFDDIGHEELDGASCRRFLLDLRPSVYFDAVIPLDVAPTPEEADSSVELRVEAWIGESDALPRRIVLTAGSVGGSAGTDEDDSSATITVDFFGYDEPVEIIPPSS